MLCYFPAFFVYGSVWKYLGTHPMSHVVLLMFIALVLKLILRPIITFSEIFLFALLAESVTVVFEVGHSKDVLVSKAAKKV